MRRWTIVVLASLVAGVAVGCERIEPAPPPAEAKAPESRPEAPNVFENPSFEAGREPWYSLASPERPFWADFEVTDAHAHDGEHSAVLRVRSEGYRMRARVYGVLREFDGGALPARVSGWYRVEDWQRGAKDQYIQVVVAVKGAGNLPVPQEPKQIAYVLAGITRDPFPIRNRRFVFTGPAEPVEGQWIPFEFFLHEDYLRYWGAVPTGYETLRVFFEARFDNRTKDDDEAHADVYFDDLYLGGA